ncbi:MFS general substrate transporter [Acephala macrosclerotiorum]|nr:MFS general substrate transporter [Acephala macrosclerotiorum]
MSVVFWQLFVADLHITYPQLVITYALNLCGTSFSCLLSIPFALKYGRRPVYVISTGAMLVITVWTAKMKTPREVFATSLLAGLAAAPNEAIVQMTVADLFFVHQRGTANGFYIAMVMIGVSTGSFLSPVGSGFMATKYGWRFCYWICSGFMAGIFLLFVFFYEETKYVPTIQSATHTDHSNPPTTTIISIEEKKINTFHEENIPNLPNHTPLGSFIGCILGAVYGGIFADGMILRLARRNGGFYEPEMRLRQLQVPSLVMPAWVVMFGLTIARGMHWILPSIGTVLFGFGVGSIGDTALTLVIDSYKDIEAQGLQNMYIVDGVLCLLVCLLYIPLMIWGKHFRKKAAGKYKEFVARNGSARA